MSDDASSSSEDHQRADLFDKKLASAQLYQSGSGGQAVGSNNKVGGAGSVIANLINGNVYVGPQPQSHAEALDLYRRVYAATRRTLPLRGIYFNASDPSSDHTSLHLAQIYVTLNTTESVPRNFSRSRRQQYLHTTTATQTGQERQISLVETAHRHQRLVILGAPGSGKSTFLNHLGLCFALHGNEIDDDSWLKHLPGWPSTAAHLLPISVVLRDFAQAIAPTGKATPQHLWRFITERLQEQNLGDVLNPLQQALERGDVLLLLDGLDEISTLDQRLFVRESILAFAQRYAKTRILVTCRTLSYQQHDWQLPDFPKAEIAPFNETQITNFILAWYRELCRLNVVESQAAEKLALSLKAAIYRANLRELATNPLLLTVMAVVHTHSGELPDTRALLYEQSIDILLYRWEQIKLSGAETKFILRSMLQAANRNEVDLKRILGRLAYHAHSASATQSDRHTLADIHEWDLQQALAELHPNQSRDWARDVIQAIKLRAGLLVERAPEIYTFPHRTFQEYLAGAHLAMAGNFAQQAGRLAEDGDFWRQVILLAVGRLTYHSGDTDKPLALVSELCLQEPPQDERAWQKVILAGEVLQEMGVNRAGDSNSGRELLARVQQRLHTLVTQRLLTLHIRSAAGDVLANLGDPRFNAKAWFLPVEPLLGFVEIPAGPFRMGRDSAQEMEARTWEQPVHEVTLPTYYIARYPVTVGQFNAFCKISNYQPDAKHNRREPHNRPVCWMNWADAVHYCTWLTAQLRVWDGTPEPLATLLRYGRDGGPRWQVTLPSEAEWEKAARGREHTIYPWGNTFDPSKANFAEGGLNAVCTVGLFPNGASEFGCLDMAGNVWEWTRSLWGTNWRRPTFDYPYQASDGRENLNPSDKSLRVLRGGAYWNRGSTTGAGFRNGLNPDLRDSSYSFRLVITPAVGDQ